MSGWLAKCSDVSKRCRCLFTSQITFYLGQYSNLQLNLQLSYIVLSKANVGKVEKNLMEKHYVSSLSAYIIEQYTVDLNIL